MKTSPLPPRRRFAAFTLAEVMIALGIVASVMIGMLGMIPHAVRSIKESNNLTVMGRISQEVISNIQMSDWSLIDDDYKGKKFLYDNEGLLFQGKEGQQPTYEARVDLPVDRVSLSSDFDYKPEHIRRINIIVEYLFNGSSNKDKTIRERSTRRYTFLVANQNKLKVAP